VESIKARASPTKEMKLTNQEELREVHAGDHVIVLMREKEVKAQILQAHGGIHAILDATSTLKWNFILEEKILIKVTETALPFEKGQTYIIAIKDVYSAKPKADIDFALQQQSIPILIKTSPQVWNTAQLYPYSDLQWMFFLLNPL
jgi:hypothetical protein